MVSGKIKFVAPDTFEGISEIDYSIVDEIGDTVFSGTVSVEKIEKGTVGNGENTDTPDTESWTKYWWVPVSILVASVTTWLIAKMVINKKTQS